MQLAERKKRREQEFKNPVRQIANLLGEEHHISIKTIESSGGTYIQYDSDCDAHFKTLPLKEYEKKNACYLYN